MDADRAPALPAPGGHGGTPPPTRKHPHSGRKGVDAKLLRLLAGGASQQDAAALVGVSAKTVQRRVKTPRFAARLAALRHEIVEAARARLRSHLHRAADRLGAQTDSDDERIAQGAAKAVWQHGVPSGGRTKAEVGVGPVQPITVRAIVIHQAVICPRCGHQHWPSEAGGPPPGPPALPPAAGVVIAAAPPAPPAAPIKVNVLRPEDADEPPVTPESPPPPPPAALAPQVIRVNLIHPLDELEPPEPPS